LRVLRDRKADLPGAADNRVRALRKVFKWAVKQEYMPTNPARDIEYIGRASEGWHSWTPEELDQFEEKHPLGSKARLALALLTYTGARRGDVVQLGPQHVRDGSIKFQQSKTGVTVELPIAAALHEAITATAYVGTSTFLVTEYGRPFTAAGFGNWFRDRCNEAGFPSARHTVCARPAQLGPRRMARLLSN
jgi:integrase